MPSSCDTKYSKRILLYEETLRADNERRKLICCILIFIYEFMNFELDKQMANVCTIIMLYYKQLVGLKLCCNEKQWRYLNGNVKHTLC